MISRQVQSMNSLQNTRVIENYVTEGLSKYISVLSSTLNKVALILKTCFQNTREQNHFKFPSDVTHAILETREREKCEIDGFS